LHNPGNSEVNLLLTETPTHWVLALSHPTENRHAKATADELVHLLAHRGVVTNAEPVSN